MKAVILTREYPPEVYGGAGVHVEYLARELAKLTPVEVRCFGADRDTARAFRPPAELADANPALQTMAVDLLMAAELEQGSIAHSHTWYANFAGHVAKLLHGVPHVMTTHSLEPLRPWKAEQLAGGYALSSFCERTAIESADAVIAVSSAMRADVLTAYPQVDPAKVHVILNGIDTEQYRPDPSPGVCHVCLLCTRMARDSTGVGEQNPGRPRGGTAPGFAIATSVTCLLARVRRR